MSVRSTARRAACAALFAFAIAAPQVSASAQTYSNPNLPRSPYGLPEPTYGTPEADLDALIDGNGELHSSGQWRHWGDSRNSGEAFAAIFAPGGVLDEGQVGRGYAPPVGRYYCARHPGAC